QDLAGRQLDDFHLLARAVLVKDERHLDRFDQVFAQVFGGLANPAAGALEADIPPEWLMSMAARVLSEEEMAELAGLGSLEALLDT
ncbi:hypothetical protein J8J27_31385, partial [Mycobacterium tuberculosis]|nr:hypothetical protein [Mycobacterium tuberculosis]